MGLRNWLTLRTLPATCFVSHAYDDARLGVIDDLKRRLPSRVSPFVFPPIDVTPDQRVSDDLVAAIRQQKGLIHVVGPHSSKSVWVNFERDYALRAMMPVYSYDSSSGAIRRDLSAPSVLRAYPEYNRADRDKVFAISAFLRERHFSVWVDGESIMPGTDWAEEVRSNLTSTLQGGGYVVAFISRASLRSTKDARELALAAEIAPHRILPAFIDSFPAEELPTPLRQQAPVILHQDRSSEIDWNRVDDLMVRIYYMVHSDKTPRAGTPAAAK